MSSRRKRYPYRLNYSPALFLPVDTPILQRNLSSTKKLLILSSEHIVEHAARRVDLFFYTLIGCYRRQYILSRGPTKFQHGTGRTGLTQACHSSFFPALLSKAQGTDQLLFNTHFNNCLNATMELPAQVNLLDDTLENRLESREKMLKVLQCVSSGGFRPDEGMQQFFIMMEKNLSDLEAELLPNDDDPEGKKYLIDLVRQGTFLFQWNSHNRTVRPEYIAMILRFYGEEMKDELMFLRMNEIQAELHAETTVVTNTAARSP